MTRIKNVFAVSFIAMFAVANVHATIMTQDNIVGGTNITISKPTSGTNAGKVVVNGPDISGKVNSSQGSSAANKAVITDGSGNITTGTITSGMITDGTITTSDISSTAGITKGQLASAVQTSLGKADTALQSHQDISGKQNVSNMVTATTGTDFTSNKTSTTKYPSMATANALAESVQNNLGSQIAGKQNILLIDDNVTVTGSGNVITAVDAPGDGSVTFTKGTTLGSLATKDAVTSALITDGTITTSDISSTAGITKGQLASAVQTSLGKADTALQSHQDISGKLNIAQGSSAANKAVITNSSGSITTGTITSGMITDGTITTSDISSTAGITKGQLASAVQTSLGKADTALQSHQDISGKQDKNNMVTATTGTNYTSNKTSTTMYASMATANQLAKDVENNLGGQIAGKQDILLSGVTGANVTFTGSGNVLTSVDAPGDGTIEFSLGRVQIPSGSETASSYASIWVE